jgi:hypothetical protein
MSRHHDHGHAGPSFAHQVGQLVPVDAPRQMGIRHEAFRIRMSIEQSKRLFRIGGLDDLEAGLAKIADDASSSARIISGCFWGEDIANSEIEVLILHQLGPTRSSGRRNGSWP